MEKNLTEEIGRVEVARSVNISAFHFHHAFTIMTGITPAEYIRNARELYQGLFTLSRTSIFLMRLQRRSRGILEFVRRAVGPGASLSAKAGIRFTRSGSLLPSLLGSGVPQFADAQPPMLRMPSQQSCSETRLKCSTGAFCRLTAAAP